MKDSLNFFFCVWRTTTWCSAPVIFASANMAKKENIAFIYIYIHNSRIDHTLRMNECTRIFVQPIFYCENHSRKACYFWVERVFRARFSCCACERSDTAQIKSSILEQKFGPKISDFLRYHDQNGTYLISKPTGRRQVSSRHLPALIRSLPKFFCSSTKYAVISTKIILFCFPRILCAHIFYN